MGLAQCCREGVSACTALPVHGKAILCPVCAPPPLPSIYRMEGRKSALIVTNIATKPTKPACHRTKPHPMHAAWLSQISLTAPPPLKSRKNRQLRMTGVNRKKRNATDGRRKNRGGKKPSTSHGFGLFCLTYESPSVSTTARSTPLWSTPLQRRGRLITKMLDKASGQWLQRARCSGHAHRPKVAGRCWERS